MTSESDSPQVKPPEWFTAFQLEMGRLLRTPLAVRKGHFRAAVEDYPQTLVAAVHDDGPGAIARLELYHEQYWRRLFNTFQETFPRTARVVGFYGFNMQAAQFLEAHPPHSYDLANAAEGFFAWVMRALEEINPPGKTEGYRLVTTPLQSIPPVGERSHAALALGSSSAPWSLIAQALNLDEAERRAFRSVCEPAWTPSAQERTGLRTKRLRYAGSFSLLRLDYELPVGQRADDFVFSTEPRKTPAHVAIVRSPRGVATYPLDPVFARLLALGRVCPLGEAIARTEKALPGPLREHLATSMDGYIDAALGNGFWVGAS